MASGGQGALGVDGGGAMHLRGVKLGGVELLLVVTLDPELLLVVFELVPARVRGSQPGAAPGRVS